MSSGVPGRAQVTLALPPRLLAAAGLGLAFACGALMARGPSSGVGLLFLLSFAPLVLFNLPLALAVWIAITFIRHLPSVSVGPNAASALVLAGYVGTVAGRRQGAGLALERALPAAMGLLLGWLTLSSLWAEDPGATWGKVWQWYVAVAVLVVVAGAIRTRRQAETVMAGFVAGAVLSVAIGLVDNGLAGTASAYDTATQTEGRLQGGGGDPNYLAAGIVPALALAGGLFQVWRDPLARLALGLASVILVIGLLATQSRGGLVAAIVAMLAAIVLTRHRRAVLLLGVSSLVAVGGAWLAVNPEALERITSRDQGGNGRSELWTVAWRMGADRPVAGVGLDNYRERSSDYVLDVGTLRFVDLIAERPHVVHNAYLQAFAETGVVGLLLLLAVYGAAQRAAWVAARRFAAARDPAGAALARALLVATAGMLTAAFFLSNGEDPRLWLLLGLGPALLAISTRGGRDRSSTRPV